MICQTITEKTNREALRRLSTVPNEVGLVEIRADLIADPDVETLLHASPRPAILTVRRREEGGAFAGGEEERARLLMRAKQAGAAYIDVEWRTPQNYRDRILCAPGSARVILSWHDFEKTPSDLFSLARTLVHDGADVIKITTFARNLEDNFRVFRMLKHVKNAMVAHTMGELGIISRILSRKFGSLWTYGHHPEAARAAPGQIDVATLVHVYQVHRIRKDTEVYGLVGNPVAHSCSPHMQNAAFRHYGLNAVYVPIQTVDLTSLFAYFPEMDVRGCSVTIPHKVPVMELLSQTDESARCMGAANTVTVKGDLLIGANTDGMGALRTIEAGRTVLEGSNVVVLGAGGSARAVGFTLSSTRRLRSLTFVARRMEQARILVGDLSPYTDVPLSACGFAYGELEKVFADADLVINCTPVGMIPKEDETPVPKHLLSERITVFDIVYHPLMTRFLREAQAAGCRIRSGLDMLVQQGAAQFETWTGLEAPVAVMKAAALEALESRKIERGSEGVEGRPH